MYKPHRKIHDEFCGNVEQKYLFNQNLNSYFQFLFPAVGPELCGLFGQPAR